MQTLFGVLTFSRTVHFCRMNSFFVLRKVSECFSTRERGDPGHFWKTFSRTRQLSLEPSLFWRSGNVFMVYNCWKNGSKV